MSAELLREAAALMRESAEAATPGPWTSASDNKRRDGIALVGIASMRGQGERGCIAVLAGSGDAIKSRHANAEHIAAWHPAVALAVADWLAECARLWEYGDVGPLMWQQANAVARAYLGRES